MPGLLQTQADACLAPANGDLVSVEQALATGLAEAQPIAETERVDLSEVTGRILAQPIKADFSAAAVRLQRDGRICRRHVLPVR